VGREIGRSQRYCVLDLGHLFVEDMLDADYSKYLYKAFYFGSFSLLLVLVLRGNIFCLNMFSNSARSIRPLCLLDVFSCSDSESCGIENKNWANPTSARLEDQ